MTVLQPKISSGEHPHTRRMSEREFDAWAGEGTHAEFVNGEVFIMAPVSGEHADLQVWLAGIMSIYARRKKLGVVRGPEFQMRFPERRFEPDILFVSAANKSRLHTNHLDGAADLVIEIVSPESAARDWHDKFDYYCAAGVREYWIIDPSALRVSLFELRSGKYEAAALEDGALRSRVLDGFYVRPTWLWEDDLPDELGILKELGIH